MKCLLEFSKIESRDTFRTLGFKTNQQRTAMFRENCRIKQAELALSNYKEVIDRFLIISKENNTVTCRSLVPFGSECFRTIKDQEPVESKNCP